MTRPLVARLLLALTGRAAGAREHLAPRADTMTMRRLVLAVVIVDRDAVRADLAEALEATVKPAQVSVWLRDRGR